MNSSQSNKTCTYSDLTEQLTSLRISAWKCENRQKWDFGLNWDIWDSQMKWTTQLISSEFSILKSVTKLTCLWADL